MSRRQGAYAVFLTAVVMIVLYGWIPYGEPEHARSDLNAYRAMADAAPGIAKNVGPPYAYRILGPYVAGLLPLPAPTAFYVLTVLTLSALLLLFYAFLIRQGISSGAAALAVFLFACNRYAFGFLAWNYFQLKDSLTMLALVALLWLMHDRRWGLFTAVLTLGALAGELSLLMIPVAVVFLAPRRVGGSDWQRFVLAAVPAVAAFAALRLTLEVGWGISALDALSIHWRKILIPANWFRLFIWAFLPVALMPLVFFDDTLRFFRQRGFALVLIAGVYVSALFGSNNVRLVAPASVVVYWLLADILDRRVVRQPWAPVVLAGLGLIGSLSYTSGILPLPSRVITLYLSVFTLAGVTVVSLILRTRRPASL